MSNWSKTLQQDFERAEKEKELAALRAALAEAQRPKTCAGCKWLEQKGFMGNDYCLNWNSPVIDFQQGFTITPDTFGCIHWEPAPGSSGGEGG